MQHECELKQKSRKDQTPNQSGPWINYQSLKNSQAQPQPGLVAQFPPAL